MNRLDSRIRWLWIGRAVLTAAVLAGIVFGAGRVADPAWLPGWAPAAVFVAFAGLGTLSAVLRYRAWRFEVREDSLYLERGVLTKVRTVVPFVRIQHVDTARSPTERLAGLASTVVYTAGSRGADVSVPGLTPSDADDLRERLKRLAIRSEGEDAV
ncbi:PH domain-containing protein [Halobellus litoreus]|jgi:membrane protein YdbS with pleckstrin-like domain|uniref:PH domain-containing protein n=1 Tax=Halobellus litoreus TaxID=755310 RepID=A0ABD6E0C2_9EURY|nr:PH domain-containing protein [Halobellus litoreus]